MVPVPSHGHDETGRSGQVVPHMGGSRFQTSLEVAKTGEVGIQIFRSFANSLTALRVDPNALNVCLKIGRALAWSHKGRSRYDEAISQRTLVPAYQRILQFGLNVRGPMNEILELEEGQRFAALTGCLMEIYTPKIVTGTYIALLNKLMGQNKDDPYMHGIRLPAFQQIQAVVERFGGIFSTSPYATSIEKYMSMDDHTVVTGGTQTRKNTSRRSTFRTIAYTDYIADALYELLEISLHNSPTQQVEFVGGADAIAIAAIGHFLIDLPTRIYKEDSKAAFVDVTGPELQCERKPRVIVLVAEEDPQSQKSTRLASRVVHLYQMNDVIKENKAPNPDICLSGRCAWHEVLSMTFGSSFEKLRNMHTQLAAALSSAARVFQALAEGSEDLPGGHHWLVACRNYSQSSFGPDYINFALRRFPELKKPLKRWEHAMERNLRLDYTEATKNLEEAMTKFSESCRCKVCWHGSDHAPRGHTSASQDTTGSKEWLCLTALVTTLIRLIRVLSGIDLVDQKLCLSRSGVEWLYNQSKKRHERQRQMAKTHNNPRPELYITRILDFVRDDKNAPEISPLTVALSLFSGRQISEDHESWTSAASISGICAYLKILEGPSRTKEAARIRVVPGCIDFKESPFNSVLDLGYNPYSKTQYRAKADMRPNYCVAEETLRLAIHCTSRAVKDMQLVARERPGESFLNALEVGFSVLDDKGQLLEWLGPARAVDNLSQGTGLFKCDQVQCHEADSVREELAKIIPTGAPMHEPFEVFRSNDMEAFIFRGDTPTALIAACGSFLPLVLTDEQCVKCAIYTGMQHSWKNFAIICSEKSVTQVSVQASLDLCKFLPHTDDHDRMPDSI